MKSFFSVIAIFLAMTGEAQESKLIYVGDPMCSWCYGISDELAALKNHYDAIPFEVVLGGLRAYGTESSASLKDFLKQHWQEVNHRSGKEFSYSILDKNFVYDTEPACRAVVVLRSLAPEKTLDYFSLLQKSFYKDNDLPGQVEVYAALALKFGIDEKKFTHEYFSDKIAEQTRTDFITCQQLHVSSFPTLLLQYKGSYYTIAVGYATLDKMIKRIDDIFQSKP